MTESASGPDVVLHIGTMKSGTSYLQAVLRRNARELRDRGVLVAEEMVPAVVDVLDRRNVAKKAKVAGAWDRFLGQVESWDGHLVVASQEFLSATTAEEASMVVDTFGGRPVRVVVTCRDLLRVIPSHWQTTIKNGGTISFAEYTQLLLSDDEGEEQHRYASGFWRQHDVPGVIESWSSAVGLDNIVVVTVPATGGGPSDVLWTRFAEAVGLPSFDADLSTNAKSNISLAYAETEMLRQVNNEVRKPLSQAEYRLLVNKYLANRVLRQPPDSDSDRPVDRPSFGRESHERIRERADAMADGVAKLGVRVIGDVDELRVGPYSGPEDREDSSGPREPISESVVIAISKLVTRLARAEREVTRLRTGRGARYRRGNAADDDLGGAGDDDDEDDPDL